MEYLLLKDNSNVAKVCVFDKLAESEYAEGSILQIITVYVIKYLNFELLTSTNKILGSGTIYSCDHSFILYENVSRTVRYNSESLILFTVIVRPKRKKFSKGFREIKIF